MCWNIRLTSFLFYLAIVALSPCKPLMAMKLERPTQTTSGFRKGVSVVLSRRSWIDSCAIRSMQIAALTACVTAASQARATTQDETTQTAASRGGKPYAPRAALLPAARLKVVVDQMYDLSTTLSTTTNQERQYQTLLEMNQLWTTRPPLFRSREERLPPRTVTPTAQLSTGVSSANKQQYQDIRKGLSLTDQMAAVLNQADVERQWGMLQYQESKREQGNELRAALNCYTSQLKFNADAYLLTASAKERKRMIRNDELPSVTAVITSDLDLRDLYRNDFLTAMEDATAELSYQLGTKEKQEDSLDVSDVIDLMQQAHSSLAKWFELIAPIDVQEAMELVKNE